MKRRSFLCALASGLCAAALLFSSGACGADTGCPVIFWSAEPVMPGETSMLQGARWTSADATGIKGHDSGVRVFLARLDDANGAVPADFEHVAVLDMNPRSLRFVVPKSWESGVYHCRIETPHGKIERLLNAPQPWWIQANLGQAASPGGWVRVSGRCLAIDGKTARLELRSNEQRISLKLDESSAWSLSAKLPEDLRLGNWQVWTHNGCGGAQTWTHAGNADVRANGAFWKDRVFDVSDFGAKADDDLDDSEAFVAALGAVEDHRGGIVRFGPGRFRMSGHFTLPRQVLIQGAGAERTHLVWADVEQPPEALLLSTTGQVGIEDLSLYAHNYLCGLRVEVPKPQHGPDPASVVEPARDVVIHRVTVRFTPLSVKGLTPELAMKRRNARRFVFDIRANNVSLLQCDLAWFSGVGFSVQGNDLVCRGNRCYAQQGGWCPVGGGRRAIVENNEFVGNTTGITRGAKVWFAHNRVSHQYSGFREGFTTDGTFGGPGFLRNVRIEGRKLFFDPERARTDPAPIPAIVRVLEGRGAGQFRRIESFDPGGHGLTVDRPWKVMPDETSLLWACNEMGHHIIYDNDWSDTGIAVQLYGSAHDCIVANNRSTRSGGFRVKGNWTCGYVQFLDNQILEGYGTIGPETQAGHSSINVEGPYVSGFKGVTARGFVIRGNRLENHAEIFLRGSVHDVLVEHNVVRRSPRGVFADQSARQDGVLLRENRFEDVPQPLYPAGVPHGYRVIDSESR